MQRILAAAAAASPAQGYPLQACAAASLGGGAGRGDEASGDAPGGCAETAALRCAAAAWSPQPRAALPPPALSAAQQPPRPCTCRCGVPSRPPLTRLPPPVLGPALGDAEVAKVLHDALLWERNAARVVCEASARWKAHADAHGAGCAAAVAYAEVRRGRGRLDAAEQWMQDGQGEPQSGACQRPRTQRWAEGEGVWTLRIKGFRMGRRGPKVVRVHVRVCRDAAGVGDSTTQCRGNQARARKASLAYAEALDASKTGRVPSLGDPHPALNARRRPHVPVWLFEGCGAATLAQRRAGVSARFVGIIWIALYSITSAVGCGA
eukprot:357031-Chlamydomonas_euryale.AAC.2